MKLHRLDYSLNKYMSIYPIEDQSTRMHAKIEFDGLDAFVEYRKFLREYLTELYITMRWRSYDNETEVWEFK